MSNQNNYKKTTFSGLIWQFAERVGAQLISTVVSIILARILVPEDYGVVALTTIFITLANVFITSGFGSALIQKKDSDDLDFSSVFYTGLLVSIALYIGLFFASPYIASWFEEPLLSPILRVVGLQLPISALGSVQSAYISKNFLFKKFFLATLLGTVISAFVGIWMAYAGFGAWALVAQHMTNLVIDRFVLLLTVKWRPKLCYSWKRTKTLFGYSWKLLGSGLLDVGYNELRGVIIGKKYSSVDLAYYNKGKSLPALVGENVNGPINGVLFPVMAAEQDDKQRVKNMTRRSIQTSCYLMFPILAGLAVIAPVLVPVLFTAKWNPCIPYMQMLCFVYAFWPVHTANLQAIKALGRSDLFLTLEVIKKVLGVAVLLITMWFGVFWIVIGSVIMAVIYSFINAFPNQKLLKYSWFEQMRDLLPYMGLTVLMGVPVYLMNYLYSALGWNMYLVLLLQVVAGIILYVGLSWLFRLEIFKYLLNTIKEFLGKRNNKVIGNSQMKKILLLGGSRYLLPVIQVAHDLGVYVITCDYLPNNIAHIYSDEYINESIIDKDAILRISKEKKIDGIMSFATDPGVVTAAYVAEKLGLPSCGPYKSVEILQNKALFRDFLTKNGFNVPKAKGYNTYEEAKQDVEYFRWPVIVKPVDSAGSKGVKKVENKQQLKECVDYALSFSPSKKFIIEEFIEKKGCSSDSDCFSVNGQLKFVSFSSQRFDNRSENIYTPAAYSWPSTFSKENERFLKKELQRLFDLLQLRTSIYNIETREGLDGTPYIMEVSPRGGGNRLAEMIKYATGVDLIKNAVCAALGEPIDDLKSQEYNGYWAEIILHSDRPGVFKELIIKDNIPAEIIEKDLWVKSGDMVGGFAGANEAIGTLVLKFCSIDIMEYYMNHLEEYIVIEVEGLKR